MVTLEGGKKYDPKDTDSVKCDLHGYETTWGELDWIQRVAVGLNRGSEVK